MPERTAGKGPYRMVMGQAVSVKASSDQHETDRIFFSFEERADSDLRTSLVRICRTLRR